MAKSKAMTKRQAAPSHVTYMHHVAWGIVCTFLLAAFLGLFAFTQSLSITNESLKQQLRAAVATSNTCRVQGSWTENTAKQLSIPTGQGERGFLVHIPKNFINGEYYPLVMFYTGKGASAAGSEATFGLDGLPAVVVYPFPTLGKDGALAWQSAPYASGTDDVAFTSAIMDKLESNLCIDKTRTYAVGFSNGGGFASLLSCELTDRFAAYAIASGALYYPSGGCTPPRPVSFISLHGDDDPIVPYDGSQTRQLPNIDTWTAMRARLSGCSSPETIRPNPLTIVTAWNKCKDGVQVQNVRVEGAGHAWGLASNQTLWQFLTKFSL